MEQQIYVMYLLYMMYLFITLALLLLLGRRIIWAKGDDNTVKHKLPPGSTGLPFVGETIALIRAANSSRRRKFFDEHELRYGPIFRSNLFGRAKAVVSVDPEFNKYIFQNEGRLFQFRIPPSAINLMGRYCLLEVHGELQKKIHGAVVNLFKYDRLSSDFMEDVENALLTAMSKWEDQRDIALQHECSEIVLKLMGKMLLDLPFSEEMNEIFKAFHNLTAALLSWPLNIPGTTYYRGIQARRFLLKTIYKFIKERREHPEVIHNDLLSKLLKDNTFSDEIIADTLLFLLFAGYDTSSSAMAFAIKFVTENPNALEELRAEHDNIIKSKGAGNEKLTWDDYQSMKFTNCVINETLRLASTATISFRETMKDVEVKEFVIPKGWAVITIPSSIDLDEKYYYDAHQFHPWRWQNEEKIFDKPFYMPFGGGIRLCPGLHLGKFEIALFLHHFLTKFRWEPLGVSHAKYFPTPHMAKGFPIRLYPRVKSEE